MKVGVLTGGGDCPGLNQCIRGVVLRGLEHGDQLIGICLGWKGLLDLTVGTVPLELAAMDDLIDKGGTFIETSRTNPRKEPDGMKKVADNMKALGLDALVAIGGDDTLGVANDLCKMGLRAVGAPKTMDNDIMETDYSFGFFSAVNVATDAVDRLRDTARSHRRVMILEVMGRHAGWVALAAGLAGGADWILIPETAGAIDILEDAIKEGDQETAKREVEKTHAEIDKMCDHIQDLRARGKRWAVVVVSEGIAYPISKETGAEVDAFGHLRLRGAGEYVDSRMEQVLMERGESIDHRQMAPAHIIRGGSPTPFDRILATRLGMKAMDLVHEGKFGYMAALQGGEIVAVPIEAAVRDTKSVPVELYEEAKTLFTR